MATRVDTARVNPPVVNVIPDYWERARADLCKRDRILRRIIPQYEGLHLISRGDPFVTLSRAIVGQQISVRAAEAVWQRLSETCPRMTPATMAKLANVEIAACGLTKRKAEYLLDLAAHFNTDRIHVASWEGMEDEAIIGELTAIRGIGRWTAEMFLIFNLLRPNVFPVDDAGLLKAISVHYFSGEPVSRSEAREVGANWEPWRSVGTWYMWRSLDPVPVEY